MTKKSVEKKVKIYQTTGNEEMLQELLSDYNSLIQKFVHHPLSKCGSSYVLNLSNEDKEDLEQELTLSFILNTLAFEPKAKFTTYMYVRLGWTAYNFAQSIIKSRHLHMLTENIEDEYKEEMLEEEILDDPELIEYIDELVKELTPPQAICVQLYYFENRRISEIAKEINMDMRNVDRNMKLGLRKLRKIIEKKDS